MVVPLLVLVVAFLATGSALSLDHYAIHGAGHALVARTVSDHAFYVARLGLEPKKERPWASGTR